MKFTGTIKEITINQGKAPYGFITPDTPIPDFEGDIIRFFGDKLIGITIEDLKIGDLVEFGITMWRKRYGASEKIAEEVKLLDNVDKTRVENINLTPIIKPIAKTQLSKNDIVNVAGIKKDIYLALDNGLKISEPAEFEDYVFLLLRLMGIHNLYQYDQKNQAGKADGFFMIGSFAVMYDCTLRKNFEEHKKEQIENYVNKLKNSQITIDFRLTDGGVKRKTLQIQGKNRQVWIITLNNTRELFDVDGIRVKEVAVQDILKILHQKINSDVFEEDELSTSLAVIDKG
ncbi:MAG TPA: hypothetical protein VK184_23765 [Nostocaceae cyanobacterium]|nr:hypothetical protein [Nostocaceae cyanobacterium]